MFFSSSSGSWGEAETQTGRAVLQDFLLRAAGDKQDMAPLPARGAAGSGTEPPGPAPSVGSGCPQAFWLGACSLYCSVHPLFLVQGLKPRVQGLPEVARQVARRRLAPSAALLPQAISGGGSLCPAGGHVHLAPVPLDAAVTREALLGEVHAALLLG